ncbi:MAG: Lar family restriction alleviation protein [Bryobacteraceae bacterium]
MTDTKPSAGELLPCPFCGGSDVCVRSDLSEDKPARVYAYHVFCHDCHSHGRNHYRIGWCETQKAACEAWNDRSAPVAGAESGVKEARLITDKFEDVLCQQRDDCDWPECDCSRKVARGGFACPICREDIPHNHSDDEVQKYRRSPALYAEAWRRYYAGTDHHPVYRRIFIEGGLFALASPPSVRPVEREISIGDIVRMKEDARLGQDWLDVKMKVVSLRKDPKGNLWVSVIDAPYDQRHRGNGIYDGETTDLDARDLALISGEQSAATEALKDAARRLAFEANNLPLTRTQAEDLSKRGT